MTIDLSSALVVELRRLAGTSGKEVDTLVEEAVRQYLDALAITDITPGEIADTQAALMPELTSYQDWSDTRESN